MNHRSHLSKDKKLKKILETQGEYALTRKKQVHIQLCASIMSQQLSTKVAQVIHQRFLNLFPIKNPTPEQILEVPFETLRAIGLSNAKTNYVRNVCEFFIAEKLTDAKLHRMKSEELMEKLIQIKGVGRWTVEMLLMFTLGYEDVFAVDDLGIQNAMIHLYSIDPTNKKNLKEEMLRLSSKWSPYRTYACLYLWGFKDGNLK